MRLIFTIFLILGSLSFIKAQNHYLKWGGAIDARNVADISVDRWNNIYSIGQFKQTGDFDPGPKADSLIKDHDWFGSVCWPGTYEIFVSKLDSNRQHEWAFKIDIEDTLYYSDAQIEVTDAGNNIVIAGNFGGSADFDPGPGTIIQTGGFGGGCIFISKYDTYGQLLWARSIGDTLYFGTPVPYYGNGVANLSDMDVDDQGNIYLTGYFYGTMDIDPDTSVLHNITASPGGDYFVCKLNSQGQLERFNIIDYAGPHLFYFMSDDLMIEVDEDGSYYLMMSNYYSDSLDLDSGPGITRTKKKDSFGFIARYDSLGGLVWVEDFEKHSFGPSDNLRFNEFDLGADGEIAFVGRYNNSGFDLDPGPGTMASLHSKGMFVGKLDSSRNLLWINDLPAFLNEQGNAFEVRINPKNGWVVSTGQFTDTVDFDPGPDQYTVVGDGFFAMTQDGSGNLIAVEATPKTLYSSVWAQNTYWNKYHHHDQIHGALEITGDRSFVVTHNFWGSLDLDLDTGQLIVTAGPLWGYDACPGRSYFRELTPDSCNNISLTLKRKKDVSCSSNGHIVVEASGGHAPYTYRWSSNPPFLGDSLFTDQKGIYWVRIIDSLGCDPAFNFVIDGPDVLNEFDLKTNLTAGNFVPGKQTAVSLDAYNAGCQPVSGSLFAILDPSLLIDSIVPAPGAINGDTLEWNFSNLAYVDPHLQARVFVKTPGSSHPDESFCISTYITPVTLDGDSSNNFKSYCFATRQNMHANQKQVYPQGECSSNYVLLDSVLTYTIRFQNTGSSTAVNLEILDKLDAALDLQTFSIVGSSHREPSIEFLGKRTFRLAFDSIMLPDSASNQALSRGYVMFEINREASFSHGTIVRNSAKLSFDNSLSVRTDTTFTTLVDSIPQINTGISLHKFSLAADMGGMRYKWIACDSGLVEPGDTLRNFSPLAPGNYAVIIKNLACSNISDCIPVYPIEAQITTSDQSVCIGKSFNLNFDLRGKPPFKVTYRDILNGSDHVLTSNPGAFHISHTLSPASSTEFALLKVEDANGVTDSLGNPTNPDFGDTVVITVNDLPSMTWMVKDRWDTLCHSSYPLSYIHPIFYSGTPPYSIAVSSNHGNAHGLYPGDSIQVVVHESKTWWALQLRDSKGCRVYAGSPALPDSASVYKYDALYGTLSGDTTINLGDSAAISMEFNSAPVLYFLEVYPGIIDSFYYEGKKIWVKPTQTTTYRPGRLRWFISDCQIVYPDSGLNGSATITVNPLGLTGGSDPGIRLYPNPNSGRFEVDHGPSKANSLLIIRDIGGKQVYSKKIGNEGVSTLDLDLSSGMYILTIRRKDNEQRIKLIIE